MGMAASQARLLSITSRMADNELRAQIINNSKMRLATESSRVSENYVNALNSATMMMSNYTLDGESQYQKLSFNALTSYSAYNNQYGLVNANGKLLVSETDDANYRSVIKEKGGLEDFLELYNLEYTSTYFTKDTLGADSIEMYGTTYTIEELQKMYEGDAANDILGYDAALQSSEYVNYTDYYNTLVVADQKYQVAVIEAIQQEIFEDTTYFADGWDNIYEQSFSGEPKSASDYKSLLEDLKDTLVDMKNDGKISEESDWYKSMLEMIGDITVSGNTMTIESQADVAISGDRYTIGGEILIDLEHQHEVFTGNYLEDNNGDYVQDPDEPGEYISYDPNVHADLQRYKREYRIFYDTALSLTTKDDTANDISYHIEADGKNYNKGDCTGEGRQWKVGQTHNLKYVITEHEEEGDETITYDVSYKIGESTAKMTYSTDQLDIIQGYVKQVYDQFKSGITSAVDRDAFGQNDKDTTDARNEFNAALNGMVEIVFGKDTLNNSDKMEKIKANFSIFSDPGLILEFAAKYGLQTTEEFQVIKNIFILDSLFEVYGEPAWGWVDVKNPDENADAKVQWYTNLFNRMQKGYSVLEKGLASSNEWIQFALESGLVTMEQVDTNNNWVSTNYANCSDITEVTNDAAVAVAEAEYSQAMNKIESKDKRFDMELKNIDTEHNSLQQEYDSVKSVIDKNIERSFKIYS